MDKYEMRRQRLQQLIDERCGGVMAECARKINRRQSYVGRLLYPAGKPGARNISAALNDAIEEAFSLPRGWLDGVDEASDVTAISRLWPSLSNYKKLVIISLIDAIAGASEPVVECQGGSTPPVGPQAGGGDKTLSVNLSLNQKRQADVVLMHKIDRRHDARRRRREQARQERRNFTERRGASL